jgi:hypothetical protein
VFLLFTYGKNGDKKISLKSAIYIGGVLQMYFGIYGERWLRERKSILELYINENWSRPKDNERPDKLYFIKLHNGKYKVGRSYKGWLYRKKETAELLGE